MSEKGKTLRTCSKGHPMDPSWTSCPDCGEAGQPAAPGLKKTVREEAPRELKKTVKEEVALEREKEAAAAAAAPDRKTKILRERPTDIKALGWLVALDGPARATVHQIVKDKTLVGTAPEADIQIEDDYASGRHCSIHFEKGKYFVTDLASANGTFVNDHKVTKKALADGDRIRIGEKNYAFKSYIF
jgi:hypothetical protein